MTRAATKLEPRVKVTRTLLEYERGFRTYRQKAGWWWDVVRGFDELLFAMGGLPTFAAQYRVVVGETFRWRYTEVTRTPERVEFFPGPVQSFAYEGDGSTLVLGPPPRRVVTPGRTVARWWDETEVDGVVIGRATPEQPR